MTIDEVVRAINEAFAGVRRDESSTLHQAQLADESLGRPILEDEFRQAKQLDPEEGWRDVPLPALDECDAALSHLTPEGWWFYLPACMTRAPALLDRPIWETGLPGSVVCHLTYRNKYPREGPYPLDWFEKLDDRQCTWPLKHRDKTEIFPPPSDLLEGFKKLVEETLKEEAAKKPMARRVHAAFKKLRALYSPRDEASENPCQGFLAV